MFIVAAHQGKCNAYTRFIILNPNMLQMSKL